MIGGVTKMGGNTCGAKPAGNTSLKVPSPSSLSGKVVTFGLEFSDLDFLDLDFRTYTFGLGLSDLDLRTWTFGLGLLDLDFWTWT